jgi:hypothetical protein
MRHRTVKATLGLAALLTLVWAPAAGAAPDPVGTWKLTYTWTYPTAEPPAHDIVVLASNGAVTATGATGPGSGGSWSLQRVSGRKELFFDFYTDNDNCGYGFGEGKPYQGKTVEKYSSKTGIVAAHPPGANCPVAPARGSWYMTMPTST